MVRPFLLNTCTNSDTVGLFFSVGNHSDVTQTIRIEYALDGAGIEFDLAFTKEVVVEAFEAIEGVTLALGTSYLKGIVVVVTRKPHSGPWLCSLVGRSRADVRQTRLRILANREVT
jgi:hypothetical protein